MNTNPTVLSIYNYTLFTTAWYIHWSQQFNFKRLHAHSNAVRIHPIEQRERNLYKIKSV